MNRKARKHVQAASKLLFGTSVPPENPTHHLGLWAKIKHLLGVTEASGRSEKDPVISEEDKLRALHWLQGECMAVKDNYGQVRQAPDCIAVIDQSM